MEAKTAKKNGSATKKDVKNIVANGVKSKENKSSVPSSKTIEPKAEVETEQRTEAVAVPIVEVEKVELTLEQKIEKVENLKTLIP